MKKSVIGFRVDSGSFIASYSESPRAKVVPKDSDIETQWLKNIRGRCAAISDLPPDKIVLYVTDLDTGDALAKQTDLVMVKAAIVNGEVEDVIVPARVVFACDKDQITADGADRALVTVTVTGAEFPPSTLDVDINGLVDAVALAGGVGQLDPITSESPCTIEITLVGGSLYWDGGGLIIGAV